ncbi:MAG: Sodium:proton antiporter [Mucilaginibacter sp.]|nr:Sodium:proton antiporter [Mucilaginibacter sp.]
MNSNIWNHALQQLHLPLTNPVLIFTLILFIILLSPILMAKIKVPDIVGFVIAGTIIGPYGLNLLTKNLGVELFATIGLLYIMFIAGIELNLAEFKRQKHKSLIFGFLTFSIPIIIGFPVCYYLLGYPLLTSLLTASMFATHTLVAYPIVSKYKLSENEAVAVTIGGTILTDTTVLIILAIIIGAKNGGLNFAFLLQLITSLTAFFLIVFFVIPVVAKWFLSKPEISKTSHFVFILTGMFFSAFLAQMGGLDPIIGAFIAALALNRLIPRPSKLFSNIEFIGNAIFIPFFLISVGMVVNFHVFFAGPGALIIAFSLTIVALAGKWVSAFLTQKILCYSNTQRKLMFGLSSSHAAATLAIILIGYKSKIIDDNILNGTVVLILVTCIVASVATENAAKKLALIPRPEPAEV